MFPYTKPIDTASRLFSRPTPPPFPLSPLSSQPPCPEFAPVFGEQAVADHIDGAEFLPVEAPEDGWEVAEGGAPGSGAGSDSDSSWGSLDEEGMAALGMAGGSDAFSSADASGDGGEDDDDAEDAAEAARKAARKVMRSRILTPRDFEMIKQAKARKVSVWIFFFG